jgi:hypothetical protein
MIDTLYGKLKQFHWHFLISKSFEIRPYLRIYIYTSIYCGAATQRGSQLPHS